MLSRSALPLRVGQEGIGTVERAGDKVFGVREGDRVVFVDFSAVTGGAHATYVVVREGKIAPAPTSLPTVLGGCLGYASLTAMAAVQRLRALEGGASVLVVGASGSVGSVVVQMLKRRGLSVHALCRAPSAGFCREIGADEIFDCAESCAGPYSAVVDCSAYASAIGGENELVRLVRPKGALLTFSNPLFKVCPMFWYKQNVDDSGYWRGFARTGAQLLRRKLFFGYSHDVRFEWLFVRPQLSELQQLLVLFSEQKLRLRIDSSFVLRDLSDAFSRAESGESKGKVVVICKWLVRSLTSLLKN